MSTPPLDNPSWSLHESEVAPAGDAGHQGLAGTASLIFVGGLVLASVTGALLHISGAALSVAAALSLLYGGIVVVTSGLVIVLWTIGASRVPRLALAILVGILVTSLVLVGGYFLTGQR